jgi:ATP-binding cassette subfamily B protein
MNNTDDREELAAESQQSHEADATGSAPVDSRSADRPAERPGAGTERTQEFGQGQSQHTAVKCLSLIGRHHGLDVSADRLIHDYSLENEEPDQRRLLRMARDAGLKVRPGKLTWKHLEKMQQVFPVMAKLTNGNYVIIVGLRRKELEDGTILNQVAIFDPLADRPDFIFLERDDFERSWKGEVILAKRTFTVLDQDPGDVEAAFGVCRRSDCSLLHSPDFAGGPALLSDRDRQGAGELRPLHLAGDYGRNLPGAPV